MNMSAITYTKNLQKKSTSRILKVGTIIVYLLSSALCNDVNIASHCADLNPYYNHLIAQGLQFHYVKPEFFPNSKCGNEWKTYGTCCDEQSLILHAKKESGTSYYIEMLNLELSRLSRSVREIIIAEPSIKKDPNANQSF